MIQAIVPAAGKGERLGSKVEKPYVLLAGIPLIVRTLKMLESVREIDSIILVVSRKWREKVQKKILERYQLKRVTAVVRGGATRMESVYAGLSSLDSKTRWVLVHDAARPLVRGDEVSRLIQSARRTGAVCPGVIPKDTIKKVDGKNWVRETLNRQELRVILTPQVFRRHILMKAYQRAFTQGYSGTDDASLVERMGIKVKVVEGDRENIKITTPEDLLLAEIILKRRLSQADFFVLP